MADFKITGAVGLAGRVYRAGDEDALAAAAEENDIDLSEVGAIEEPTDATDAAKELADENDLNLSDVEGTGSDGRITKSDVEAALEE